MQQEREDSIRSLKREATEAGAIMGISVAGAVAFAAFAVRDLLFSAKQVPLISAAVNYPVLNILNNPAIDLALAIASTGVAFLAKDIRVDRLSTAKEFETNRQKAPKQEIKAFEDSTEEQKEAEEAESNSSASF
jgi:hypothetical protein